MEQTKELTVKVKEMTVAITTIEAEAKSLVVKTPKQLDFAARLLNTVKGYKKRGEERRLFFTKPMNDQIKNINDLFRPGKQKIEEIEETLTGKIRTYREEEAKKVKEKQDKEEAKQRKEFEKRQKEERERIKKQDLSKKEKKEKEEGLEKQEFVPETVVKQETKVGDMGTTKRWTFEVIDEERLPREYLCTDRGAITDAVRKGERNIPGVRIFQKEGYTGN